MDHQKVLKRNTLIWGTILTIILPVATAWLIVAAFTAGKESLGDDKGCTLPYNPLHAEFDNVLVTGIRVESLIKENGGEIAILVHTLDMQDNEDKLPTDYVRKLDGIAVETGDGETVDTGVVFVNYGAQLDDGTFTFGEKTTFSGSYKNENGVVVTNENIENISLVDTPEYLKASGKFEARLIKDNAGSTIGVLFIEKLMK